MTLSPPLPELGENGDLTGSMLFDIFQHMQDASGITDAESKMEQLAAGQLRVGQLLGSGRHGFVLQATLLANTTGNQSRAVTADTVAVKMPAEGKSLDAEADAIRRFGHHPHIVELIDGPNEQGALILEFCALGTLADQAEANALTVEQTTTVLKEIGSALAAIHSQGWIHGDVSLGNIGLRSDGTTALLDFATAREASNDYITEGTAEYSGPIRSAHPRLDIRCLAASVKSALPSPTAEGVAPAVLLEHARLDEIIKRCDDLAQDVSLDELVGPSRVTTGELAELITAPPAPRPSGGGPDRPQTSEFGPRPGGGDSGGEVAGDNTNRTRIALASIAVLGLLIAFTAMRFEATPTETALVEQQLVEVVPSHISLAELDVKWANGVATRHWPNGDMSTFAVGEPGDIAAVGDWNCTGDPTLGVYRPETGAWFTFSTWEPGATSGVVKLNAGSNVLSIERNIGGCDRPVIS